MDRQGSEGASVSELFVEALRQFAAATGESRLTPMIGRLGAPMGVAVRGRPGVGCRTVAAALWAADVTLAADPTAADIDVLVVAEVLKPEDLAACAHRRPSLIVLNKADLSGFGPGGPMAAAQRRAARYRAMTGVATVPMIGLLATATLDDELVAALHAVSTEPADLGSTDGFVSAEHPAPRSVRIRLLDTLDLFGIAHAVLALRDGADAAGVRTLLWRLSQVGRAVELLDVIGAEVRYRRMRSALAELEALAVTAGDDRLAQFLASDDVVIARMASAVDVVEAAGLRVDGAAAHTRRAVRWQRYAHGPVSGLHRACGADIVRGSLRLLRQAQRHPGGA